MADPIRQLLSQTSYVADGVTTVWNFSFSGGYLDKSHVKAKYLDANAVIQDIPVTLDMFTGPYQLNITPAVGAGRELTIYRDTPKSLPLVDFADKAALTEASLDLNAKQAIFVAAESNDLLVTTIASTSQIAASLEATLQAASEAQGIAAAFGDVQGAVDGATEQATLAAARAELANTAAEAATVQAGLADGAMAAAILARDASFVTGPKYASEVIGRAAVADGGNFLVQGSGEVAAYEYKRITSEAVSTLIATYPSVASVVARAKVALGKNLFDKLAVTAGKQMTKAGIITDNATYCVSGHIAVTAGVQYTASVPGQSNRIRFLTYFDGESAVLAGGSNSALGTFTPPAGAVTACLTVYATDLAVLLLEVGSVTTAYEAYRYTVQTTDGKRISADIDDFGVSSAKLASGAVVNRTIGTAAVSARQTDFLVTSKNLFDLVDVTADTIMSAFTGVLTTSVGFSVSGFIKVSPATLYQITNGTRGLRTIAFFDESATIIPSTGLSSTDGSLQSVTTPALTYYMRLTVWTADLGGMQIEAADTPTTYAAFGALFNQRVIVKPSAGSVGTTSLADHAVGAAKTAFLALGKNLFIKQLATSGYLINATTGGLQASTSYVTSPLIPVTAGVAYYARGATKGIRTSAYFTASGGVVAGGVNDATGLTYGFTPPAGAVYTRVSAYLVDIDSFQVERGAVQTSFQAAGYYPVTPPDGVPVYLGSASVASAWTGKVWAGLGDSLTAQAMWQGYVITALGLIYSNFGIAGTRLSGAAADAMWQDARINAIPTTLDVLTLAAGTNDWAQNVTMGAVDSTDTNTFNGAFNSFATKAMARWPAKRIIVQTTPYGEFINFAVRGWANGYTNTLGLTTRDYAEAIRVQCKRWGFPCADVASYAGWNSLNISTFITNDGDYLHPNITGGRRMAEVHIGTMRAIEPTA